MAELGTKIEKQKQRKTERFIWVAKQRGRNWKTKSCCAVHPKAKYLMCNHLEMSLRDGKKIGNKNCNCEIHSHVSQKPVLRESKVMSKLRTWMVRRSLWEESEPAVPQVEQTNKLEKKRTKEPKTRTK